MTKWFAPVLLTAFCLATCGRLLEGVDMSNEVLSLGWQWPAGRAVQTRMLVRVDKLKKERRGWFGIRNSPSMADHLPDPIVLSATVLSSPSVVSARQATLRLPQKELGSITAGQVVGLGLLDNKTCICIRPAPSGLDEAGLAAWLSTIDCGETGAAGEKRD